MPIPSRVIFFTAPLIGRVAEGAEKAIREYDLDRDPKTVRAKELFCLAVFGDTADSDHLGSTIGADDFARLNGVNHLEQ